MWPFEPSVEKLLTMLDKPGPENRVKAIRLLAKKKEVRAVPKLIELLKDNYYCTVDGFNSQVNEQAARALEDIGTTEAMDGLLQALLHELDEHTTVSWLNCLDRRSMQDDYKLVTIFADRAGNMIDVKMGRGALYPGAPMKANAHLRIALRLYWIYIGAGSVVCSTENRPRGGRDARLVASKESVIDAEGRLIPISDLSFEQAENLLRGIGYFDSGYAYSRLHVGSYNLAFDEISSHYQALKKQQPSSR